MVFVFRSKARPAVDAPPPVSDDAHARAAISAISTPVETAPSQMI
jgi:hypothetical protein